MIVGTQDYSAQVRYPTAAANNTGTGSIAWSVVSTSNGNDAKISELSFATEAIAKAENVTNVNFSQRLFLTDFGFDIPSDAVIKGIVCELWTTSELANSALNPSTYMNEAYIIKGGSIAGDNKGLGDGEDIDASGSMVSSYWMIGNNTDMWGNTLTPADVNSSNFGVSFQFYVDQDPNNDVYVMRVSLAIVFEPAPILLGGIVG